MEKVAHPDHYNNGNIECIEAIAAAGHAEGFCIGNCMKYLWRYKHKNGDEDLAKAQFYLNWYLDYLKRDRGETESEARNITPLAVSPLPIHT